MEEKNLCGIRIHNITKEELMHEIERLIKTKKSSYVVTPYSEFILLSKKDKRFKKVLNSANISIADGVGILLGLKYFSLKGKYFPLIKCLLALIFNRSYFRDVIKEKLSGSEMIYEISKFAAKKGFKVFLLGGFDFGKGNTGILTKKNLEKIYPKIKIVGVYSGSPEIKEEKKIIREINKKNPEILFIAYGSVKEEKWIYRNIDKLKPLVGVCVGGSFDYVAKEKRRVPKFLCDHGFEGILRPIYSERGNLKLIWRRIKRGWVGIISYIHLLLNEKK